ncbi:MAG: fimbrial protein [Alistipes sp.]
MKRLFHIAWMCLAVAACSKDELPGTHGEFASLTLSVASSQNDVKTRAVSADADEQRINNLYIFIFNPDGSVDCRNYISSLSASSWTGTIGGLTCGTGKAWPPLPIRTIRSSTLPARCSTASPRVRRWIRAW